MQLELPSREQGKKVDVTVAETPKEEVKNDEIVMPALDKGPATFFDTKTGAYWIGLPLKNLDLLTACLILDSEKFHVFERYHQMAAEAQKNKIVSPWQSGKHAIKKAAQSLGLLKP